MSESRPHSSSSAALVAMLAVSSTMYVPFSCVAWGHCIEMSPRVKQKRDIFGKPICPLLGYGIGTFSHLRWAVSHLAMFSSPKQGHIIP